MPVNPLHVEQLVMATAGRPVTTIPMTAALMMDVDVVQGADSTVKGA